METNPYHRWLESASECECAHLASIAFAVEVPLPKDRLDMGDESVNTAQENTDSIRIMPSTAIAWHISLSLSLSLHWSLLSDNEQQRIAIGGQARTKAQRRGSPQSQRAGEYFSQGDASV